MFANCSAKNCAEEFFRDRRKTRKVVVPTNRECVDKLSLIYLGHTTNVKLLRIATSKCYANVFFNVKKIDSDTERNFVRRLPPTAQNFGMGGGGGETTDR